MIHYKSSYGWRTICCGDSDDTLTITRNKKKVTCKKCKNSTEFKKKTKWQKFLERDK